MRSKIVLGPLPRGYRVAVVVSAIAVFVAIGAWAAFTLPVPVLTLTGAGVGAALGVVASLLLVHDFSPVGTDAA